MNHKPDKLKILMCSEASFLSSGFATYYREILNRLYKTNKYELAELASYGFVNDPRDANIPWKYYANAVREGDPRHEEYNSRTDNQFGRWRFDKVILDFKPDIVVDVRDYWMSSYQALSPLRKFFHWILMPTVDSEPQQESWIDTFISADAIFTYSDWGAKVLQEQSANKINYIDTVSPGVDLDVFNINRDKISLKKKFGLPEDSFIIGSVMRNQKRKLIPELLFSFRKLIDNLEINNYDLGSKTYLYLHTSYPDAGWDIPELLRQTGLSNRVFFTYTCPRCNYVCSTTFSHPSRFCPSCSTNGFKLPSVTYGISPALLSEIYNTFDLYVQYSICEGFGMPQVEAAACGVPVITVNYSAMCDVIQKLKAYAVEPQTRFKELETKAIRVYPNNDQLIEHIINFMSLSEKDKLNKRLEIRKLTEKYYNWDNIAKIWENYFDSISFRANWDMATKFLPSIDYTSKEHKYNLLTTMQACDQNLQDPDMIGSCLILDMLKDADYGFLQSGLTIQGFSYKDMMTNIKTLITNHNQTENIRAQNIKFNDDFIQYADLKAGNK